MGPRTYYGSKFERVVDVSRKLSGEAPGEYSIRDRVIDVLWMAGKGAPVIMTATELAGHTKMKLASLSSTVNKMVKAGELMRAPKFGVRGGYGYYVPYRGQKPRR